MSGREGEKERLIQQGHYLYYLPEGWGGERDNNKISRYIKSIVTYMYDQVRKERRKGWCDKNKIFTTCWREKVISYTLSQISLWFMTFLKIGCYTTSQDTNWLLILQTQCWGRSCEFFFTNWKAPPAALLEHIYTLEFPLSISFFSATRAVNNTWLGLGPSNPNDFHFL